MTSRFVLPLLLLAMQSALPAQDVDALLRKGEDALRSELWEMAALHFSECLETSGLDAEAKSHAAIRLAEAWIRDGKAADALDLLGQSFVADHPEAPFWKGQALAGLGQFADAVNTLSPLAQDPSSPFRSETVFTTANLKLALGKPDAALATLSTLADSPDPAIAANARLHQVEILLELGRNAEARATMPDSEAIDPQHRPLATFLEANLLLAEGRPDEAASDFQQLVEQPKGQTLRRYHAAVIGLADALRDRGAPETAADVLLNFIQNHKDSPLLEEMFKRVEDSLPESPTRTNPTLERLAQWIRSESNPAATSRASSDSEAATSVPAYGPIANTDSATAAYPIESTTSDLLAFSLYTRALGLHRIGTAEARDRARVLLTRLRLENPQHFLANRALLLTAKWALENGFPDRAFNILDTLRETVPSRVMQGEAAFLQARTAWQQGDREQAAHLFESAASSLSGHEADAARFNAAIARLMDAGDNTALILQTDSPENPTLAIELELERALSTTDPIAKRAAIEEFLTRHPGHPREAEARLAAAEAALAGPKPDLSFAHAQIDTIAALPDNSTAEVPPSRIALLKLRIADLAEDSTAAIVEARAFLEQYPAEYAAAEAALILGRNLFQTRNFNDAHLVLKKLAESDTDPARAQAARLLAGRSAALVPTIQSQQEALTLFDKALETEGPVASLAKLEKARLMIDMNRLAEAADFLRQWFDELAETDPLHLPAGLLLGEAIYAQGNTNPDSLSEALEVYDKLLVHAKEFPTVFNRLQYLRGRTLEQLPDPQNPDRKRDKEAFVAYYSVLETTTPPAEWKYFELCGFNALKLLENAGRWPAAIACAKKIASFNGPRASEAARIASQIQLKYMIWED